MRTFLAAAILAGVLATGAHAATYEEKLATCLACHGEKGISETSEVPSLAGMPADFTLIQLFLFRQGTRKIEIMNDRCEGPDRRRFAQALRVLRQAAAAEGVGRCARSGDRGARARR